MQGVCHLRVARRGVRPYTLGSLEVLVRTLFPVSVSLRPAATLLVAALSTFAACADVSSGGGTTADAVGDIKKSDTGTDGTGAGCAGVSCDDGDPCTDDHCDDASKGCVHVPNALCKDTTGGGDGSTDDTGITPDGPSLAPGDLIITEIMYNPYGGGTIADTAGEWFEIYNATDKGFDLGGLVVSDASKDSFTVTSGSLIAPKGYFVLGISADGTVNGGASVNYAYAKKMTLNNTFDAITLPSNGVSTSNASVCNASPASSALAWPNCTWTVGLPRRSTSLSMQGMSSCTRE